MRPIYVTQKKSNILQKLDLTKQLIFQSIATLKKKIQHARGEPLDASLIFEKI